MALIDKASLLMVPSTYEAGKLYNVLPSGNRAPDNKGGAGYDQTRADFDFDRGSNAAATRINSSGLIEKYRENVLLQSNSFGTTWSNLSSSETSGQEGYDGTTNAWLLTTTGAGGRLDQSVSLSGVQSFNIYAKANTFDFLFLLGLGASDRRANFDLTNGVVATTQNLIDSSIESIGNGWYRCSITYNDTISGVRVLGLQADNNFTGTSGSIYIQNAQLETSLVATDYLNSTSVTAKAGVLIDLPRINFDANGENGALLLEPSRQQLLPQSEYFGAWDNTTYPITISTNAIASPSGFIDAALLTPNSGNNRHALKETISCSATTYTLSAFYKKDNAQYVQLSDGGDNDWHIVTADLNNGTITNETNATGTIEPYANDWYRITCTFTRTSASTIQAFLGASPTDSNSGLPSFDNTSLTTHAFGAMLEAGSYATSYIPNHGTSGGVTRAADSCLGAGDVNTFNSSEGVLYTEISALENDQTNRAICIYKDSSLDNIIVIQYSSISQNIRYLYRQGVTSIADINFVVSDITSVHKIAGSWENNNFRLFVDGIKVGEQLSGNVAPANTFITLGFNRPDGQTFFGNAKQVAVFNEALSDSELATLTTL